MLQAALDYWRGLDEAAQARFPFSPYLDRRGVRLARRRGSVSRGYALQPNSPYSASKAASDHLVRAWQHTYGLPTVLTNCSNNYGPYHFPEKLIPLMILNALEGKPLPVYGRGENVARLAVRRGSRRGVADGRRRGGPGENYNIGGNSERRNIDVVEAICDLVDELAPDRRTGLAPRTDQLRRRSSRPRFALRHRRHQGRARTRLAPDARLRDGPAQDRAMVSRQRGWWRDIRSGAYRGERLGVAV